MSDNISANDINSQNSQIFELCGKEYAIPHYSFFTEDLKTAINRINNEKKKEKEKEKKKEKEKEKSENPKEKAKNKKKIVVKLPSQTPGSVSSSPPPGLVSSSPPPGSSSSSPPFRQLSASPPPFYPRLLSASPPPPPYQLGLGWNLHYPHQFGINLPMPIQIPHPQIVLQPNNIINYETSDGLRLCKNHDGKWYYLRNNIWLYLTPDIGFIDKTDVRFTILRQPYGKYSYVNQI